MRETPPLDERQGKDEQGRERPRPDDRRNGSLSDHDGEDRRKPPPPEKPSA